MHEKDNERYFKYHICTDIIVLKSSLMHFSVGTYVVSSTSSLGIWEKTWNFSVVWCSSGSPEVFARSIYSKLLVLLFRSQLVRQSIWARLHLYTNQDQNKVPHRAAVQYFSEAIFFFVPHLRYLLLGTNDLIQFYNYIPNELCS